MEQAGEQLRALPRWARQHRRDTLTGTISGTQYQVWQVQSQQATLGAEIEQLSRRVEQQARERDTTVSTAVRRAWAGVWDGTSLASPRATDREIRPFPRGRDYSTPPASSSPPTYRSPQPERGHGRSR